MFLLITKQPTTMSNYSFWDWKCNFDGHSKEFLNLMPALERCVDLFVFIARITSMYRVVTILTDCIVYVSMKNVNKNPCEIMHVWCNDPLSWMMHDVFSNANNLNKTITLFEMFIQSGVYEKWAPSTNLNEIDTSNRFNIQHSIFYLKLQQCIDSFNQFEK